MSKERAHRRAEREREAAVRAAARAAEAERQERRAARKRALTRHLPGGRRPAGVLDRRRQQRTTVLVMGLVAVNLLVWFAREDWGTRLGVLVVSVLAAPVLYVLLFPRR